MTKSESIDLTDSSLIVANYQYSKACLLILLGAIGHLPRLLKRLALRLFIDDWHGIASCNAQALGMDVMVQLRVT